MRRSLFRQRRLLRYLLRELRAPTLLALTLFSFVLLMNHFFLVAGQAISKNLSAELTLQMFLVGLPPLLVLIIPMSTLLGCLIGLGRLSSDHEWVAMQSAGCGLAAIYRAVVLHGLLATVACFAVYNWVVPWSSHLERSLRMRVLFSANLAADLKPRIFWHNPQATLFVEDIVPGVPEQRLRGVIMALPGEGNGPEKLVLARAGDLYPDPDNPGALLVDLYDGEARLYSKDPAASYKVTTFQRAERHSIPTLPYLQQLMGMSTEQRSDQSLYLHELFEHARAAREELDAAIAKHGPQDRGNIVVPLFGWSSVASELHQRFALPFACVAFTLVAVPLGLTFARTGKGAGFALSLLVILLYRVVFVLTRNQGARGNLSPVIGVWTANAVIVLLALLLWWHFRRRDRPGWLRAWLASWRLRRLERRAATRASPLPPSEAAAASDMGVEVADEIVSLGGTSTRFIRLLDLYVMRSYGRVLLLSLGAAYLIFALVTLQGLMEDILKTHQPLSLIAVYYVYFLPTVFADVLPVACLIGSIVAFTLLARSSELVAMMASGVGLRRATAPVLLATVGLCGVLFVVQNQIAPGAHRRAVVVEDRIRNRAPKTYGASILGQWTFGPDGRLVRYGLYDPDRQEFRDLHVFTLDRSGERPRVVDHLFSERARWVDGRWELEDGWFRGLAAGSFEAFEGRQLLPAELPEDLVELRAKAVDKSLSDQLSLAELGDEIDRVESSGYDSTRLQVAFQARYARAAAPLVMVLLGLPFAFKIGRRGSLYSIGVALLLVLVYWATFAVFNALGLETLLHPLVAAWTPNVLFGLLGSSMLLYVRT